MAERSLVDLREPVPEIKVSVVGDVDIASAPRLHQRLMSALEAEPGRVLADLANVTFIDSTGLGVLVNARIRARTTGTEFALVLPRGEAARFPFELTGLVSVFETSEAVVPEVKAAT